MIEAPTHLSYSSFAKYAECSEKWRLSYGYGNKGGTYFSTLYGTGFHEATEAWDKLSLGLDVKLVDPMQVFRQEYGKAKEKGQEVIPSGKELKELGWAGGPNKRNEDWIKVYGPLIEKAYYAWRESCHWQILSLPDGTPCIELEFDFEIDGVPVIGAIDRVFFDPHTWKIIIVDLKSGNEPDSELQLAVYKLALLKQYGIEADYGVYWFPTKEKDIPAKTEETKELVPMVDDDGEPVLYKSGEKKGQPRMKTVTNVVELEPAIEGGIVGKTSWNPVDLVPYSEEYVSEIFRASRRGIEHHVFVPSVTRMCDYCPVFDFCRAKNGKYAHRYPVTDEIKFVEKRRDTPSETGEEDQHNMQDLG